MFTYPLVKFAVKFISEVYRKEQKMKKSTTFNEVGSWCIGAGNAANNTFGTMLHTMISYNIGIG